MKNNFYFLVSLFSLIYGCSLNKKAEVETNPFNNQIQVYLNQYYTTNDTLYLHNAYELIENDKEFKETGPNSKNYMIIIPILFNLKKYDELLPLLDTLKYINEYDRTINTNLVKYLKKDKIDSIDYIQVNIDMIEKEFIENPGDSTKLLDYYIMRIYKDGLTNTLWEIDSLEKNNNSYSKSFYENILKEGVISYSERYRSILNSK